MARKILTTLSVLLVAALAWAGDPWKEKSYKEWNEKEVKKILNDSPWSHTVHVSGTWGDGSGSRDDEPNLGSGRSSGGGGSGAAGPGASGPRSSEDREFKPPKIPFQVRWVSSRTVREAMARNAVLQGKAQEGEAEKFLEQQPAEYMIAIVGEDMRPLSRADAGALKEKSYLMAKSHKQKRAPLRVEVRRTADGKRVSSVVFFFTRRAENGEPVVAADEKELEFSAEIGSVLIKTSFSPQKMAATAGMDL